MRHRSRIYLSRIQIRDVGTYARNRDNIGTNQHLESRDTFFLNISLLILVEIFKD